MTKSDRQRRIAIGALKGECNPRSPIGTQVEFDTQGFFLGDELLDDLAQQCPVSTKELKGFVERLGQLAPDCQIVPLLCAVAGATGPIEQGLLYKLIDEFCERIRTALPIDAVYLALHGSCKGEKDEDPEATLLKRIRNVVGSEVPIVATLDLHANVSAEMVEHADSLIAYRTNPHIDKAERAAEAASLVDRMLRGTATRVGFVKLPLIAPSPTHLTNENPIQDVLAYGQSLCNPPILNVSVTTGFTHGDSPKSGMAVTVTAENDEVAARRVAAAVGKKLWEHRDDFVLRLTTIEQATELALESGTDHNKPAIIFADTSDNPGGGGRGNTIWILSAFHKAKVDGCVIGGLNDPDLAAEAHRLGEGASLRAVFNRNETHPLSGRFEADAVIERIHDGKCISRRGVMAGRSMDLGPACLLRIDGIRVLVISKRIQCYDPTFFEIVGVDIATVRSIVVKSRGHFRAGFDEFFGDNQIRDVDVPGITARRLDAFPFKKIPRPMYPLDPEAVWSAEDWL